LSVDFEDYLHDFQRMLGIAQPRRSPSSLRTAYTLLDTFSRERLDGTRMTFFTTGQVARDDPDLVRRIAGDGHEIACHYYEHDQIWHQDRTTFRTNLELAVEALSRASGQVIKGFRAPDFSIDASCAVWAYEELARIFVYDSSHVASTLRPSMDTSVVALHASTSLSEVPVFSRLFGGLVDIRVIGGSYLRLLPLPAVKRLLHEARSAGFLPHVYVHPYDILHNYEQWSTPTDLAELPLAHRAYWRLRQHQWHTIGNRSALSKLSCIFDEFRHAGPMASFVETYDGTGGVSPISSFFPDTFQQGRA
jgi:peptidoglycan/xylan/chitin deacetylase (PgdA/CDA1 family)